MSDAKVTDLQAATTLANTDWLYLVQGSNDRKVSIATLLGNLPNTPTRLKGILVAGGTPQTLVGPGTIQASLTTTLIQNIGIDAINIDNGTYDGQVKIVIMTQRVGTSTISSNIGASQIAFSAVGHAVLLLWFGDRWWPVGGTAAITP